MAKRSLDQPAAESELPPASAAQDASVPPNGFWAAFGRNSTSSRDRHSFFVSLVIVASVALVALLIVLTLAIGRMTTPRSATAADATPTRKPTPTPTTYVSPTPTGTRYTPEPIKIGVTQLGEPIITPTPTPTPKPSLIPVTPGETLGPDEEWIWVDPDELDNYEPQPIGRR